MPKYFLNNFEKVLKTTFLYPKRVKKNTHKNREISNFLIEIFNIWDYLSTLGANNTQKSRPSQAKTMLNYFPNNSKTTIKKSRKRLFWLPKWSKNTPKNSKNEQIFYR